MHWRHRFAALSDRFRVIAWNAPGYMLSDGLAKEMPDCRDFADALADFLAALRLDRVSILANSFGTRVAQCFAIFYPGHITRLVMTGTGIGARDMSDEEKRQIVAAREAQIAKGGYAFAARVDALLASGASPATVAEVHRVARAPIHVASCKPRSSVL